MARTSALLLPALAAGAALAADDAPLPLVLVPRGPNFPIPTPQQLRYAGGISGLAHFNMATFFHDGDPGCDASNWLGCDPNGGCNASDVNSFAPSNLNISSWIASLQDLGATSIVLTAKHGCGFLLWPTQTTVPGPDGSPVPYRYHVNVTKYGSVLQSFSEQMAAAGIGYGFYYSLTNNFYLNVRSHNVQPPSTLLPGQANVTQQQFEDLAIAQVTELWNSFGNLTEIWLDGGCGDLCDRVEALIPTTLAANAAAFNGGGVSPGAVRWCGTEGGNPSKGPGGAVWSTAACDPVWCAPGSGPGDAPNTTGAIWYPSGIDFCLQNGDHWFWTPGDSLHSLADLISVYHSSVGSNGHLELDFAIDRTGGVDPGHAAVYRTFGNWIRSCYGAPLATGSMPAGANSFTVALPGGSGGSRIDRVSMSENQANGQNVITYVVEYTAAGGSPGTWLPFSSGTTIGSKRIDILSSGAVSATAVRLTVTSAFSTALPVTLSAFSPAGCQVSE